MAQDEVREIKPFIFLKDNNITPVNMDLRAGTHKVADAPAPPDTARDLFGGQPDQESMAGSAAGLREPGSDDSTVDSTPLGLEDLDNEPAGSEPARAPRSKAAPD